MIVRMKSAIYFAFLTEKSETKIKKNIFAEIYSLCSLLLYYLLLDML